MRVWLAVILWPLTLMFEVEERWGEGGPKSRGQGLVALLNYNFVLPFESDYPLQTIL